MRYFLYIFFFSDFIFYVCSKRFFAVATILFTNSMQIFVIQTIVFYCLYFSLPNADDFINEREIFSFCYVPKEEEELCFNHC